MSVVVREFPLVPVIQHRRGGTDGGNAPRYRFFMNIACWLESPIAVRFKVGEEVLTRYVEHDFYIDRILWSDSQVQVRSAEPITAQIMCLHERRPV